MTISITANKCSFDTYEVTISSPVEPGGGDHIATIDFGDPALAYALSIKLEGVAVYGGCSLYFTSAGESYTLEVKSLVQNSDAAPVLKWTYTVHGLYAPVWADVKGDINIVLDFSSCCAAGGTRYWNSATWADGGPPAYTCTLGGGACSQMANIAGGWVALSSHNSANNTQACGPCPLTSRVVSTSLGTRNFTSAFTVPANANAFYAAAIVNLPITLAVSASGQDWTGTLNTTLYMNKAANSYVASFSNTNGTTFTAEGASRCLNPGCTGGCSAGSSDSCSGSNCAISLATGTADLTAVGGCGAIVVYAFIYVYRRTFTTSNSVYVAAKCAIGIRE